MYQEKSQEGNFEKFAPIWFGSYQIFKILGDNVFRLATLEGEALSLPINEQFLKHYF